MALIGHEIIDGPVQRDGYVRFYVDYEFDSGPKIRKGPLDVPTLADVPAKITEMEVYAIRTAKKKAAHRLIDRDDDISANGEATAADVASHYMYKMFHEHDIKKAFKLYKKIRAFVNAQGWTAEQVRQGSGMNQKQWRKFKARIDYFADNLTALNAAESLLENDPGGF